MTTAKKAAAKKSARKATPATASNAVDEQLARYRSMRDFGITAEPSGGPQKKQAALPFCIQKHAASHLHYDFRLGWNGVLKSWAVAKGPSYVVADRRLAVQVEDHPIEYGGFEGIIPAGQYGGGTVMLWDQGTWEPQEGHDDVDAGLRDGSLKFILKGTKMHGKWALVRMGGKAATERKPNWLLIKEHDDFERPPDAPAITEEEPNSVVTKRSLEQIAAQEDHVWNSKDTAKGKAWYRQEKKSSSARPKAKQAADNTTSQLVRRLNFDPILKHLTPESQPLFIKPQLALQAEAAPKGPGWLHELKLDGYRIQARKDGDRVQMLTRSGLDWTHRIPSIADAVRTLPAEKATLDGEVVVLSENGTTNFAQLQAAFQDGANNPLTYFCFDLLHLNGHSTRDRHLVDRKALLADLLDGLDTELIRLSEHIETSGQEMFQHACALHAEGIISKRSQSQYVSSRNGDWLKLKCLHEQEFVIGGYTLPSNGIHGVGALLLGYYEDDKLIYAGRTGTGFNQKTHRSTRDKLDALAASQSPFAEIPSAARKGAKWVKPKLVAQVRFATWTADLQLRQAAFLGLREDKPAKEVVREEAAPTPKRSRTQPAKAATHRLAPKAAAKVSPAKEEEKAPVRLTHPDKVLDPESGLTKQALADYYWAIAEAMLPHIAGRPLSLVRCPEGAASECFYQKHVTSMLPKDIATVMVTDKKSGKPEPYITLDTRETLAGLAQMSVLEIHPWGSKNDDLEHPDRIVIDLDPDTSIAWSVLAEAASNVRKRLKQLGLESFLKTTGGKGLHIVAPIEPEQDWKTIKVFARSLALAMEKASPSLYLSKMTKSARVGKIYIDYLRNERGATAVAPYSPRARAGVNVSMPLSWKELEADALPKFSVTNLIEWKPRLKKDPWKGILTLRQKLTAQAIESLRPAK
ncbi:DNA ligase D [Granulicella aggregans]|uniref:DNA ligase D n=1 Tax=Granulicella aggregans TaxID=474949 RepID=UPI0021E0B576|nr:DNA ligase D [Granulicella aggregans]